MPIHGPEARSRGTIQTGEGPTCWRLKASESNSNTLWDLNTLGRLPSACQKEPCMIYSHQSGRGWRKRDISLMLPSGIAMLANIKSSWLRIRKMLGSISGVGNPGQSFPCFFLGNFRRIPGVFLVKGHTRLLPTTFSIQWTHWNLQNSLKCPRTFNLSYQQV